MPYSHRAAAAFFSAISGFSVMIAMGSSLFTGDLQFVVLAAVGAAVGGWTAAPLFGRPGRTGVAFASAGAIIATALGAALAGFAMGLPSGHAALGLVFGPATVGVALATSPIVLATWLATMVCAHQGMAALQKTVTAPS